MRWNNQGTWIHGDKLRDRLDSLKFHLEKGMEGMLSDAALKGCQYVMGCVNAFIDDLEREEKEAGAATVDLIDRDAVLGMQFAILDRDDKNQMVVLVNDIKRLPAAKYATTEEKPQ